MLEDRKNQVLAAHSSWTLDPEALGRRAQLANAHLFQLIEVEALPSSFPGRLFSCLLKLLDLLFEIERDDDRFFVFIVVVLLLGSHFSHSDAVISSDSPCH